MAGVPNVRYSAMNGSYKFALALNSSSQPSGDGGNNDDGKDDGCDEDEDDGCDQDNGCDDDGDKDTGCGKDDTEDSFSEGEIRCVCV